MHLIFKHHVALQAFVFRQHFCNQPSDHSSIFPFLKFFPFRKFLAVKFEGRKNHNYNGREKLVFQVIDYAMYKFIYRLSVCIFLPFFYRKKTRRFSLPPFPLLIFIFRYPLFDTSFDEHWCEYLIYIFYCSSEAKYWTAIFFSVLR